MSKKDSEETFREQADDLFSNGHYEKLLRFCEDDLKTNPKNINALWYVAKVHYEKNNKEQAVQVFEKISEIEPRWESQVRPYIEKLKHAT